MPLNIENSGKNLRILLVFVQYHGITFHNSAFFTIAQSPFYCQEQNHIFPYYFQLYTIFPQNANPQFKSLNKNGKGRV